MRSRLLALTLLLLLFGCQPRVMAQAASVYVHWLAPAGSSVNVRAADGSWAGSGVTNAYGTGGLYVPRRSVAFMLSSPAGCVVKVPVGAMISLCAARFELPDSDRYGDFVIEAAAPTSTATATSASVSGDIYTCNDARHVEIITSDGRTTVLVVCEEER